MAVQLVVNTQSGPTVGATLIATPTAIRDILLTAGAGANATVLLRDGGAGGGVIGGLDTLLATSAFASFAPDDLPADTDVYIVLSGAGSACYVFTKR